MVWVMRTFEEAVKDEIFHRSWLLPDKLTFDTDQQIEAAVSVLEKSFRVFLTHTSAFVEGAQLSFSGCRVSRAGSTYGTYEGKRVSVKYYNTRFKRKISARDPVVEIGSDLELVPASLIRLCYLPTAIPPRPPIMSVKQYNEMITKRNGRDRRIRGKD